MLTALVAGCDDAEVTPRRGPRTKNVRRKKRPAPVGMTGVGGMRPSAWARLSDAPTTAGCRPQSEERPPENRRPVCEGEKQGPRPPKRVGARVDRRGGGRG